MFEKEEVYHALLGNVLQVASHLLPNGKQDGKEWRCGDVRGGAGQSLAVCLEGGKAGVWSDFATGEGGDLLDLWQAVRGCDFKQALRDAAAFIGVVDRQAQKTKPPASTKQERVQCDPPQGENGVTRFTYTDANKTPIIYVTRRDEANGKKSFYQWGHSADGKGWVCSLAHTPKPRPLYRLCAVLLADVECIHEGEKAVVAACKAGLPFCHASTIGGAGNGHHTDFSPLHGKRVIIVPDHDEAGEKHALALMDKAKAAGASFVGVVRLPDLPPKGDVVEWLAAGGTPDQWAMMVESLLKESRPQPLPNTLKPVLPFDVEMLPWSFKQLVVDVAERMQCPPDFPAVVLLVAAGSLIGRRCAIYPKAFDNWQVTPNLWGALIGRPSLMKSPSMQSALKPLDLLIQREVKAHLAALDTMETEEMIHAAKVKAWKAEIGRVIKQGGDASTIQKPRKPTMTTERRFKTNEGSVECLISLLNDNPDGLLLLRDELVGWLRGLDKAGREGARQFFLEAWNGNGGGFDYDTFSHGHMHCESLCLSVLGTIQTGPLSEMVKKADAGGKGDDGLIQRFQLMVYPDIPKAWKNIDRKPDKEAAHKVESVFEKLAGDITTALHFDGEAQSIFDSWREKLESQLREEDNPIIESHLAKFRSLMPSIALIIHLVDIAERHAAEGFADLSGMVAPVSARAAKNAVQWCIYLESHVRRIYGLAEGEEVEAARRLLGQVIKHDLTPFSCRTIARKGWTGLVTTQQVKQAVDVAESYGWLIAEDVGGKGRPSVVYHLHDDAASCHLNK